jgi:serine/threonine protein phosphatase PrpC
MQMIEFGHATHVGRRRHRNEDTCFADPALGLFLVADGLGGHHHGALAASLARDSIVNDVRAGVGLEQAIRHADAVIIGHPEHYSTGQPMGTTIALLHLTGDTFQAAWVGDSRIYFQNDAFKRLSHDHSVTQQDIDGGILDEESARHDPRRNLVTQALGVTAPGDLVIETTKGPVHKGNCFLLCSDGLTDELEDNFLERCIQRKDLAAQECVDHLLLDALDAGGHDNVTAVLVRIART